MFIRTNIIYLHCKCHQSNLNSMNKYVHLNNFHLHILWDTYLRAYTVLNYYYSGSLLTTERSSSCRTLFDMLNYTASNKCFIPNTL